MPSLCPLCVPQRNTRAFSVHIASSSCVQMVSLGNSQTLILHSPQVGRHAEELSLTRWSALCAVPRMVACRLLADLLSPQVSKVTAAQVVSDGCDFGA